MAFQVGDRVRRNGYPQGITVVGQIYTVSGSRHGGLDIQITEDGERWYTAGRFDLVEEIQTKYMVVVEYNGRLMSALDHRAFESRDAAIQAIQQHQRRTPTSREVEFHLVPVRSIGSVTNEVFTEF